jgi:hypothetical protein
MTIAEAIPNSDHTLRIVTTDGYTGIFDVKPYLEYAAFRPLTNLTEFMKISNGGFFLEWECGAGLSADTIEAKMNKITTDSPPKK